MNEFNNEQMHEREATIEQVSELFERAREFIEREGQLIFLKDEKMPQFVLNVSPAVMSELGMNPDTQAARFMSEDATLEEGSKTLNSFVFTKVDVQNDLAGEVYDIFLESKDKESLAYKQISELDNVDDDTPDILAPESSGEILEKEDSDEIVTSKWPSVARLKLIDDILRAEAAARKADYPDRPIDL